MTLLRKVVWHVLSPAILLGVMFFARPAQSSGSPPKPSSENLQFGKIISVRKVLRNPYRFSRYPQIHYYLLYISLSISGNAYCSEYETPVLDEIDDVFSANGKDVVVAMSGDKVTITTPKNRKLKTRLTAANRC